MNRASELSIRPGERAGFLRLVGFFCLAGGVFCLPWLALSLRSLPIVRELDVGPEDLLAIAQTLLIAWWVLKATPHPNDWPPPPKALRAPLIYLLVIVASFGAASGPVLVWLPGGSRIVFFVPLLALGLAPPLYVAFLIHRFRGRKTVGLGCVPRQHLVISE